MNSFFGRPMTAAIDPVNDRIPLYDASATTPQTKHVEVSPQQLLQDTSGAVFRKVKTGLITNYPLSTDSDTARGTALVEAVAAATAAGGVNCIYLGPGTYDLGNSFITLPDDVHLIGAGMYATVILSPVQASSNAVVKPGSRSHVCDLTINCTASGLTIFHCPLGAVLGQTEFNDARIDRVRVVADTDGVLLPLANSSMTLNHCRIETKWDGVYPTGNNAVIRLNDCEIIVAGPTAADVGFETNALKVSAHANALLEARRCRITATGGEGGNNGATVELGTLRLIDCDIKTSALIPVDLRRTSGILEVTGGLGSGGGGAWVTAGAITHLDGRACAPMVGTGAPEGAVTAPAGTLYLSTNGGAGTTLYVKESGAGNTGWVAK